MNSYETQLFRLLSERVEEERKKNRERAVGTYQDLNYYHAAVSRETTLANVLEWMEELKGKTDQS